MVEVTKHNFSEILNEFSHDVNKCLFYSIDCEYSCLPNEFFQSSFFDLGEDRYIKLLGKISKCIVVQVGITIFRYNRDLNQYTTKPYNFYVFPQVFGKYNVPFLSTAASINFLCRHNFDFNKVYSDGISYMNRSELKLISNELREGTLLASLKNYLDYDSTSEIIKICDEIKKWSLSNSVGACTDLSYKPGNHAYNFVLREMIIKLNNEVWASTCGNKITVKKVTLEQRTKYEESKNNTEMEKTLLESLVGFSKVVEILFSSKKPLVGHNMFYDIFAIYHQFYEDLPASYSTFKQTFNKLVPQVFDTKIIANYIKKKRNFDEFTTSLQNMYELYQDKNYVFHFPVILMEPKGIYEDVRRQQAHSAGWDAYMTGFIFLKMMHEVIQEGKQKHAINVSTLELFSAAEKFQNIVSIARAQIVHMRLDGADPQKTRPPLLYISSPGKKILNEIELDIALRKYEPLHKKPYSKNSALIAVPNYTCFKKILVDFSNNTEFKVEKYSLIRHNRGFRTCLITGLFIPVAISLWLAIKPSKLPSS